MREIAQRQLLITLRSRTITPAFGRLSGRLQGKVGTGFTWVFERPRRYLELDLEILEILRDT